MQAQFTPLFPAYHEHFYLEWVWIQTKFTGLKVKMF